jgi:hypothetical protein
MNEMVEMEARHSREDRGEKQTIAQNARVWSADIFKASGAIS